ncbi:PREDICTED: sex determination protein fruitless-like [Vollenhovia emeryi]|uniref:sex determination protein fruitless-like n=1 Tax=Vollenhovia emeryi TaxID=411798 RepID=UPI0005F44018|nr:PREDICTED: sex determination protein fruitless-like [Vollenhovia emeryi]XP_011865497.1 PREDICTED: sex determination protein fruitless-like [Vollenhovia emeryi]
MATTLSPKEFSLRWNNFSNNLTSGFLSHLSENYLVDVTIAVEGQLLAAHKLVLSVCSPYFKNIFKENPCQHPVIILKDVKHSEITSLLKFMYQGEVNVKQEDLPTFLKLAQMLQIKGLVGGEEEIIPLLNNYANVSDQRDSDDVTALSDVPSEQDGRSKASDGSAHSHRIVKRSTKTRKRCMGEDDYSSIKKLRNESSVNNKDDICLLSDNDERDANDSNNEKDIGRNATTEAINHDSKEIIELSNEETLEENSLLQSAVEPVIYRLSARGRPQLVHEGYVYNMTSRSKVYNSSHYRCAEQHRGCRGKCSVIAETFMPTGVHEHNHPPSYQSEYDYRKKKGLDTDNV